ncbi:MAG: hypothetical protein OHK0022_14320 [Roseiflexaceae bacterium]
MVGDNAVFGLEQHMALLIDQESAEGVVAARPRLRRQRDCGAQVLEIRFVHYLCL